MSDEELIRFATEFRDGILDGGDSAGMCFAVSAPLIGLLDFDGGARGELVESLVGDTNHVWIRLSDGRALDPTADQFNDGEREPLPPVYLGPPAWIHQGAEPWSDW